MRAAIDAYISSRPKLCNQYIYGFDAHWFWKKGVRTTDILYDTLVEHYIANPEGEHGLYSVQSEFADYPEPNWKSKEMYKKNIELVNAKDVIQTRRAHDGLYKYLYRQGQWDLYEKHVMPLQWVLLQLRLRGVRVNRLLMYKYHLVMQKQLEENAKLLRGAVGPTFNWRSPKQLCELLYDRMNLPVRYNKDGNRTSEKEALEYLFEQNPDSKLLRVIMKLRKIQHLDSHYLRYVLDDADRIYPQLMCHVAANGRLACKDPTIHNIPEGPARRVFIPDEGHVFIYGDYSQIEFMTWTWYGAEWDLLRKGWEGYDFHRMVAALFFGLQPEGVTDDVRHKAKFIDFGLIYGRGAPSIAKANGIAVSSVETLIGKFADKLPGAWAARNRWVKECREQGYCETAFKRRRYMRPRDATKVYNFKPAGTAADITGRTLNRIFRELEDPDVSLTPLTVHDSFTVQCPPDRVRHTCERLREIATSPVPEMPASSAGMPNGARFRVALKVGYNWDEYDEKGNPDGLKDAETWLKENGL
jgi:DNA polymerase-1